MKKNKTLLIILLSSTLGATAQNIELGKVNDKGLLYYENGIVTIKVGYTDLKGELERLSYTEWCKNSTLNKSRVEKQIKFIDSQIKLLEKWEFGIYKITDFSIKFSPDSVLIDLFRKTIGSSLLLQGKALVKFNNNNTNESSATAFHKENSIKFLSKDNDIIFEGGIIK